MTRPRGTDRWRRSSATLIGTTRLAAYAYTLAANPDPSRIGDLIDAVTTEGTPFGQYWGVRALRRSVQAAPGAARRPRPTPARAAGDHVGSRHRRCRRSSTLLGETEPVESPAPGRGAATGTRDRVHGPPGRSRGSAPTPIHSGGARAIEPRRPRHPGRAAVTRAHRRRRRPRRGTPSSTTEPAHGPSMWAAKRVAMSAVRHERERGAVGDRCHVLVAHGVTSEPLEEPANGAVELARAGAASSVTRAWTAPTSTSSGRERFVARTQHCLDHGEVKPALLGDRAHELRPVRFERLDHRHVVVEDPPDRRQWESGRLQLLDLQAAGELGGAVVPVSRTSGRHGTAGAVRPPRSAVAPPGRPAIGGPGRRSSSAPRGRLDVSAANCRQAGEGGRPRLPAGRVR